MSSPPTATVKRSTKLLRLAAITLLLMVIAASIVLAVATLPRNVAWLPDVSNNIRWGISHPAQLMSSGTNGQQLRIYICSARSVLVAGFNQNDHWVTYRLITDPNSCQTYEIGNWWWRDIVTLAVTYGGETQMRHTYIPRSQMFSNWWNVEFNMPELSRVVESYNGLGVGYCDPNLQAVTDCGLPAGTEMMRPFHIMPTIAFQRVGPVYSLACSITQADLESDAKGWGQLANLAKLITSGGADKYRVHKGWYFVGNPSANSSWGAIFGSMIGDVMNPNEGTVETVTNGPLRYAETPYEIVVCSSSR